MSKKNEISTYQEGELQNPTGTYYEDTPSVKQNTCNSIKVTRGEWLLYSETDYKESCVHLPLATTTDPGQYTSKEAIGEYFIGYQKTPESREPWGDRVSSLRPINQDNCLTKFLYPNLCGEEEEHQEKCADPEHTEIWSLVVRGRYAWQLYPTGDPDFGYEWNDNKPLIVYPGIGNDILDVRTIPGYNEDKPLTVVLVQPMICPCPGKK